MSYFVAPDTGTKHHIFGEGAAERIATHYGLPILGQLPISATEFGGPTARNERSDALKRSIEWMVRELGKSRAGRMHPEITFDEAAVTLTWPDGRVDAVENRKLRAACQCAVCVDEFTGEQKLSEEEIPEDIHAKNVAPVGNYAISIEWSDGHSTGFFPYDRVRALSIGES
jgi:DUF971 family protein